MEAAVERWIGISLVVIGLSHLLHPRPWADLFAALRRTGHAPLVIGLFTLPQGLILLALHPRWTASGGVVVTALGWVMTIKGAAYLLAPRVGDRVVATAEAPRLRLIGFRVAGLAAIGIGIAALLG